MPQFRKPIEPYEWAREGTWLIVTRTRSLGESSFILFYSQSYSKIWRYWLLNTGEWQIAHRENGYSVPVKPIPPKRLKKIIEDRNQRRLEELGLK